MNTYHIHDTDYLSTTIGFGVFQHRIVKSIPDDKLVKYFDEELASAKTLKRYDNNNEEYEKMLKIKGNKRKIAWIKKNRVNNAPHFDVDYLNDFKGLRGNNTHRTPKFNVIIYSMVNILRDCESFRIDEILSFVAQRINYAYRNYGVAITKDDIDYFEIIEDNS